MTTEFKFTAVLERNNGTEIVDEEIKVTVRATPHTEAVYDREEAFRYGGSGTHLHLSLIEHAGPALSQREIDDLHEIARAKWGRGISTE